MNSRWLAATGCLVAALAMGVGACGDDEDEGGTGAEEGGGKTVTVYSSLPLQGASRPQTTAMVNGIKLALEQERRVTVAIADLFTVARETHDYLAEQFLHWFLEEQVEEEAAMSDLLAVAERTREIPVLLEEYLARETPGEKE